MDTLNKSIYNEYEKPVQEYMNNVIDCLRQDYKEIPASWRISLDLIADNYSIYLKARKLLKEEGLASEDSKKTKIVNPTLKVMNTAQDKIIKLLSTFALTPLSRSKMKNLETGGDLYDELTE